MARLNSLSIFPKFRGASALISSIGNLTDARSRLLASSVVEIAVGEISEMTSRSRRRGASYRPNYDTNVHRIRRRTNSPSTSRVNNPDPAFSTIPHHAADDENASKRVKREGNFYRPDRSQQDPPPSAEVKHHLSRFRPRPLPEFELPPSSTFSIIGYFQRRQADETQRKTFIERNWSTEHSKSAKRQARIDDLTERIRILREKIESLDLPKDEKNEKEAELAKCQAMLRNATDRSKTTQHYHNVRCMERNQGNRVLKQLRKEERELNIKINRSKKTRPELENKATMAVDPVSEDEDEEGGVRLWVSDPTPMKTSGKDPNAWLDLVLDPRLKKEYEELQQKMHAAEVDYNYCCFAPLEEPYICLFPTDERGRIMRPRGPYRAINQRNGSDREEQVQKDRAAGILRTSTGVKPPFWSEVEDRMRHGTLEELRDGKLSAMAGQKSLLELGDKNAAAERVATSIKRRHSWMDDDEMALEDLETEHEFDTDDEL